jgi:glycosyltransferase involved in cell wall biosynthesis
VTDNEFVNYGSPIKVREYLATGKPVVITPIYEYERLNGILRVSRGYDDFIAKVEDALSNDSMEMREARQTAVRASTWDARAEEVSEAIRNVIESTKSRRH